MNKLIRSLLVSTIGIYAQINEFSSHAMERESEAIFSTNLVNIKPLEITPLHLLTMLQEGQYLEGNYQWKMVNAYGPLLNALQSGYVHGISLLSSRPQENKCVFNYHANGEGGEYLHDGTFLPGMEYFITIEAHPIENIFNLQKTSFEEKKPETNYPCVRSVGYDIPKPSNNVPFKIFEEPNMIKNTTDKDFYVEYNADKSFWVGFEYLTAQNVHWWSQRLGCDAYMLCGKEVKIDRIFRAEMSSEQQTTASEMNEALAKAFGFSYSTESQHAAEEFIAMMDSSPFDEQYENLVNSHGLNCNTKDYIGAWRGFNYNLKHYAEAPTWVAYVSSHSVKDQLYKNTSVTSPTIKMAMTLQISHSFYCPLGIYSCPTAQAYDKEAGNTQYTQLSIPFHAATARFVGVICPEVKYMVVRPLKSMTNIFKKSGLDLGSGAYVDGKTIVDPRTHELYQMSKDHWLSKSSFLGGADWKLIEAFPFVTIDRQLLEKKL